MHRSSESIASLAAALAKAQAELVNPAKSLVGSIKGEGQKGGERLFRYASLASGLDVVRKTLGQHEIATVQTTTIDQTAGIVNLTTMLAHASGQWIASDWPVCPLVDWDEPHRAGMALTYARRYGLFTLAGIAGEDDLDAPDLVAPTGQISERSANLPWRGSGRLGNGHSQAAHRRYASSRSPAAPMRTSTPEQSAVARDRLLAELAQINSAEAVTIWARQSLPPKNSLTADDAQRVETGFQIRLAVIGETEASAGDALSSSAAMTANDSGAVSPHSTADIDKANLAFSEPRRIRDKEHLRFVAKQACLICGRSPCDAHHLRYTQARALGRKASDEFVVPLCRGHHRELHRCGDEAGWWRRSGIDPSPTARQLWLTTHPLHAAENLTPEASALGNSAKSRQVGRDRVAGKRGRNNETKPISTAAPQ